MQKHDVVIIGGGIVGSSVAYHLVSQSPGLSVCVVEPDSTYEFASALRASGGCRTQFSCPENIEMSRFGIEFIKRLNALKLVIDCSHTGLRTTFDVIERSTAPVVRSRIPNSDSEFGRTGRGVRRDGFRIRTAGHRLDHEAGNEAVACVPNPLTLAGRTPGLTRLRQPGLGR